MTVNTIVLYPKLQPDTIAALFLLKKFGRKYFDGIEYAKVVFWSEVPNDKSSEQLENEGCLVIDMGGGRFDHHSTIGGEKEMCVSEIVAEYLGLSDDPALQKLLAYVRRDDLEGKGTISDDPLDRAFGLSGLIMNLNKSYIGDLNYVLTIVEAIFNSHFVEEEKRTKLMPELWNNLKQNNQVTEWTIPCNGKKIRIAIVPTDDSSFPGFIRAYAKVDMVVARRTTGHVNVITKQARNIDLSILAVGLRQAESIKKGFFIPKSKDQLIAAGRIKEAPEWFYDVMANSIQNGGIDPQGISPTQLSDETLKKIIDLTLSDGGLVGKTNDKSKPKVGWVTLGNPLDLGGCLDMHRIGLSVENDLNSILEEVNKQLGAQMTSRSNEWHITIFGPEDGEFSNLFNNERLGEMDLILSELQNGEGIIFNGIGYIDSSNAQLADGITNKTCFISVGLPHIAKIRRNLGLSGKDFHITLGFEGGDLYNDRFGIPLAKKSDDAFDIIWKKYSSNNEIKITNWIGQKKV